MLAPTKLSILEKTVKCNISWVYTLSFYLESARLGDYNTVHIKRLNVTQEELIVDRVLKAYEKSLNYLITDSIGRELNDASNCEESKLCAVS